MSYFDVDRRRDGTYGSESNLSGSHVSTRPGANDVGSYQVSGVPFAKYNSTFSNTNVSFPAVTQWLVFTSKSGEMKYSFSAHGITDSCYGTVAEGESTPCLPIRTAEVWITGNGSVTAGLTNISSGSLSFDVSSYNNN